MNIRGKSISKSACDTLYVFYSRNHMSMCMFIEQSVYCVTLPVDLSVSNGAVQIPPDFKIHIIWRSLDSIIRHRPLGHAYVHTGLTIQYVQTLMCGQNGIVVRSRRFIVYLCEYTNGAVIAMLRRVVIRIRRVHHYTRPAHRALRHVTAESVSRVRISFSIPYTCARFKYSVSDTEHGVLRFRIFTVVPLDNNYRPIGIFLERFPWT